MKDPTPAALLRATLESLRAGEDPVLRDLADDILAGRMLLSDVATTTSVLPALQTALHGYAQWREALSDEEFANLTDQARNHIALLRSQIEEASDG